MRKQFREWYAPTTDELKRLWSKGTFILDSNVLLGLYQYPPSALEDFLTVLVKLKDRLWLPQLAGLEYHRNRDRSLPQQRAVLEHLVGSVEELVRTVDTLGLPEYHPTLDLKEVEARRVNVQEAIGALLDEISVALEKTPQFNPTAILGAEPIRDRLTTLFDSRVGAPLKEVDLERLYKDGLERYAHEVPPGYKDKGKPEPGRYADLVIWRQVLDHCKSLKGDARSAVFVTNDRKEDWWLRKEEKLLGPRPELVREFMNDVDGDFWMYTPADFLKTARQHLQLAVSEETIADVQRISVSSPVATSLRYQRMVLPPPPARLRALSEIYDALTAGRIQRVSDLQRVIEGLGEDFASNYVEAPLFFSLIKETYGPIEVANEPALRLRDRSVKLRATAITKESFLKVAHLAWLAQALFRVRFQRFSDEEMLVAFFGDDYSDQAPSLLDQAKPLAASDQAYRGG